MRKRNLKSHLKDLERVFEDLRDPHTMNNPHTVSDLHTMVDLNDQLSESKRHKENESTYDKLVEEHRTVVEVLEKKIQDLTNRNKCLKKELMDLKGSVRVLCRVRPSQDRPCDLVITDSSIRIKKDRMDNSFEFDRVLDGTKGQKEVFREIEDSVESIFEGYKACVFAYGQTGSGKTHTMIGSPHDKGILGRSLEMVKSRWEKKEGWEMKMMCSCLEIYNEEVRDLLGDSSVIKAGVCKEVEVVGDTLEDVVQRGLLRRRVGSTMSNSQSSRSHTIFILRVEMSKKSVEKSGALCLVDLAGSERLDKSKAEGIRLKETQNINRSLSSLGDVFTAILNKDSHIPFRNSRLTFFLQEYLIGKSRVSMILNISSEDEHYHETVCTLRFGSKVSECKLGKVTRSITQRA